ncbi:nuclear transport factor 2 family protein [Sphingomonas sp.]|uniref:nuclear transport factor 2 family protein n=1 Tax=Sphingomonas sp. TaxID=28214 RepID=UPI0025FAD0E8|nr:nuclear transport factor 2 family protein [Sphingomonas sp.]
MFLLRPVMALSILIVSPALAQPAPDVRVPADIGAAYGRLGRAIQSHDAAGVKTVWAEDFVVNSPNNTVLRRDEVIAAMEGDLLDYKDFRKHITYVGEHPDVVIVMGYDTMVPLKGPGAGKHVMRPFTDFWMKRAGAWMLIARQATIAAEH